MGYLWDISCHMGSPAILCKQTLFLNPSQTKWCSIYLSQRDERLSWPRWAVTYQDGLTAHRWSPIQAWPTVELATCWSQVRCPNNNNNNNINHDDIYSAVIMAEPLLEFTRFKRWTQKRRQVDIDLWTEPTDLSCRPAYISFNHYITKPLPSDWCLMPC